jgi:sterol desaturase/sphingolipid hydroxylase (fatty acid hydroxylase superfamily)
VTPSLVSRAVHDRCRVGVLVRRYSRGLVNDSDGGTRFAFERNPAITMTLAAIRPPRPATARAFVKRIVRLAPLLVGGTFVVLTIFERWRPLRPAREAKLRRVSRNLVFAGLAAATVNLLERPLVQPLASTVERRRLGLLHAIPLPAPVHLMLAVVLLDYTLYIWHVLVHRVPWLWRFHLVHHMDLDLDASTALRFHFGELAVSIPWRAAQIAAIGVGPNALALWQNALLISILFHHSNVQLPIGVERVLSRILVTPRVHGIHHSIVPEETNSNWSSGLTVWDRLHGTLRLDVPQNAIAIGVAAYRSAEEVTLGKALELPFVPQPPWRLLPGDGEPSRHEVPVSPTSLQP